MIWREKKVLPISFILFFICENIWKKFLPKRFFFYCHVWNQVKESFFFPRRFFFFPQQRGWSVKLSNKMLSVLKLNLHMINNDSTWLHVVEGLPLPGVFCKSFPPRVIELWGYKNVIVGLQWWSCSNTDHVQQSHIRSRIIKGPRYETCSYIISFFMIKIK